MRSTSPQAGDAVGDRFRLGALRDRDDFGVWHEGTDLATGGAVAVRLLVGVPPPTRRFEVESRRAMGLQHAHLGRLHGTFRLADGRAGYVVDPPRGDTLADRCAQMSFGLAETLAVLDAVLAALEVCHAAGVTHRDVRPEQVRLFEGPGGARLRLDGAGVAQLFSDGAAPALGGVLYGHPQFTAPEQWVNRAADARTDLYAVGLLGYVMISGRHFVEPGAPLDVCRRHFRAQRPAPVRSASGERVPPDLAAALVRAAHPEARARFPDATAMRAALATIAARTPAPLDSAELADLDPTVDIEAELIGGSINLNAHDLEAMLVRDGDPAFSIDETPDDTLIDLDDDATEWS